MLQSRATPSTRHMQLHEQYRNVGVAERRHGVCKGLGPSHRQATHKVKQWRLCHLRLVKTRRKRSKKQVASQLTSRTRHMQSHEQYRNVGVAERRHGVCKGLGPSHRQATHKVKQWRLCHLRLVKTRRKRRKKQVVSQPSQHIQSVSSQVTENTTWEWFRAPPPSPDQQSSSRPRCLRCPSS